MQGLESSVCLESDFVDYYDYLCSSQGTVQYIRKYSDSASRSKDMQYLKTLGVKTIEIRAVREFVNVDKLVVYTDPYKHNKQGKILVDYDEAIELYPNCPASKFYTESNGLTLKYLQVGKFRYKIYLQLTSSTTLEHENVVGIDILEPAYNLYIKQPIFSIDYTIDGDGLLAIDYNRVQNLSRLGMQNILTAEAVISEIKYFL